MRISDVVLDEVQLPLRQPYVLSFTTIDTIRCHTIRVVLEDGAEGLVANLGEGRVHHENQTQGDRNVRCPNLEAINEGFDTREDVTHTDTRSHGEEYQKSEVAIQ